MRTGRGGARSSGFLPVAPGVLSLLVLVAACASEAGSHAGTANRVPSSVTGPDVRLVDSLQLSDPDTVPLGARLVFTRSRTGTLYLADAETGVIVRYPGGSGTGHVIGWRGNGPGEFLGPGTLGLVGGLDDPSRAGGVSADGYVSGGRNRRAGRRSGGSRG